MSGQCARRHDVRDWRQELADEPRRQRYIPVPRAADDDLESLGDAVALASGPPVTQCLIDATIDGEPLWQRLASASSAPTAARCIEEMDLAELTYFGAYASWAASNDSDLAAIMAEAPSGR